MILNTNKLTLFIFVIITLHIIPIQTNFLLIMGPSGAGKSTIINYLKQRDSRFLYVSPFTTRDLRDGETDKVHVSLEEIRLLEQEGKLLTVNNLYDVYYATPKHIIDDTLAIGNFPILDWPIEKLDIMNKHYKNHLYTVYVEPDNFDELAERLSHDNRDKEGKRYIAGLKEINNLNAGIYDHLIDLRIVNQKNYAERAAEEIYQKFIAFTNTIDNGNKH